MYLSTFRMGTITSRQKAKVEIVPVLNQLSINHEDVWGSEGTEPPLLTSTLEKGEWSASRPDSSRNPSDRRLGGPRSWSGRFGGKKHHLAGNRISNMQLVARRYTD
jgi:hypothetical protein